MNPSKLSHRQPGMVIASPTMPLRVFIEEVVAPSLLAQRSAYSKVTTGAELTILMQSPLGRYPLKDLNSPIVFQWWSHHQNRGFPVAANKQRQYLNQVLRQAIRLELIVKNPVDIIKPMKANRDRVRWLEPEQRVAILAEARRINPRLHRYIWLAMHTIVRRRSLYTLNRTDIDLTRGTISYRKTKNGTDLVHIPLVPECLEEVAKWLQEPGPFLFPYKHPNSISWGFARIRDRLGITGPGAPNGDFTFHDLRHDLATRLVEAGVDLLVIKELGGWKTMAMVARYAHAKEAVQREALGKVFGGVSTRVGETPTS